MDQRAAHPAAHPSLRAMPSHRRLRNGHRCDAVSQKSAGVLRTAARRIGIPFSVYSSMLEAGQKWCTRCKMWHPRSSFSIDRSRGDGLKAACRPAPRTKLTKAERRTRANATYRRYYAGSGGPSIRARVYARKRDTEVIPSIAREMLFETFGGRCAYCPAVATTVDHVVPVMKGGQARRGNLIPACGPCNSRKNASDFDLFLARCLHPSPLIADELVMSEVC